MQVVVSDFESALWSAVSKVHGATWRLSPRLHFPLLPGVVAQYPGRWVAGSVYVRRRRQSRLSIDYGTAISAGECDRRRIREGAAGQQWRQGGVAPGLRPAHLAGQDRVATLGVIGVQTASANEQWRRGLARVSQQQSQPWSAEHVSAAVPSPRGTCPRKHWCPFAVRCGHLSVAAEKYTRLHSRLSMQWDEYDAGRRSANRLLTACSRAVKHMWTVICNMSQIFCAMY